MFTEERDRRLTGAMARKADTVQALLRGDVVDRDKATRVLGHRLARHQLEVAVLIVEQIGESVLPSPTA